MCIKALKICTEFQSHLPSLYQCMKINPIFNSRPITMQDFEFWIDFSALIRWSKLTFKVDISLTKRNLILKFYCRCLTSNYYIPLILLNLFQAKVFWVDLCHWRFEKIASNSIADASTSFYSGTCSDSIYASEKIVKWLDLNIAPCNLTRKIGA